MLRNRFLRFLLTILMFIAIILPTSILEILSTNYDWEWDVPSGPLFLTPLVAFAVCIVGQLCGDILDVDKWLNNGFVTFLKRVIFFAVVLAALVVGMGMSMTSDILVEGADRNASVFEVGINLACMYAPAIALLSYVLGYVKYSKDYHSRSCKRWLPFFFPISYAASILLGILMAFIMRNVELGYNTEMITYPLVAVAMVVIAIVVCVKSEVWPFDEDGDYEASYNDGYSGYTYDEEEYDNSGSTTSTGPADCEHCAYHTKHNPDTGLYGGDYCLRTGKPIGYFDMLDGCSGFVKE